MKLQLWFSHGLQRSVFIRNDSVEELQKGQGLLMHVGSEGGPVWSDRVELM